MRTVTVICLEQGKPTCIAGKLGGGPEAKQTRWTEKPVGPPKGSCGGKTAETRSHPQPGDCTAHTGNRKLVNVLLMLF